MNTQSTQVAGGNHLPVGTLSNPALAQQLLDAFDQLQGVHPGFRPAHAKGLMCSGQFVPSAEAAKLTRAPHASPPATPVTVRYSDSTGLPTIPDNDPARSGPGASPSASIWTSTCTRTSSPTPLTVFRSTLARSSSSSCAPLPPSGPAIRRCLAPFSAPHPNAKRFVEAPKPIPTSFAREAFFAVTAFKFTNSSGVSQFGRFRIRPEAGTEHLSNEAAAALSPNFLFDELGPRLAKEPVKLGIFVQIPEPGDDVADASTTWPAGRAEIPFGTITLTARVDDQAPERRKIIFDPLPRVDGIDPSGDPLTQARADLYLLSGRRRRAALGDAGKHA